MTKHVNIIAVKCLPLVYHVNYAERIVFSIACGTWWYLNKICLFLKRFSVYN